MDNIKMLQRLLDEYGVKEVLRVLSLLTNDPREVLRVANELHVEAQLKAPIKEAIHSLEMSEG